MKTPEQFVNEECAVYNAETLVKAVAARDAEVRAESRAWRLANELFGVAQDVDGECVCDDSSGLCECGGDGQDSDGDPLEMGCASCWAKRLREVAAGINWPERALETQPTTCVCPFPRVNCPECMHACDVCFAACHPAPRLCP